MQTVIEPVGFVRRTKKFDISDEAIDYIKLVVTHNPCAGNVIRGTVGGRKVRVSIRDKGKSGSYRLITFLHWGRFFDVL